MKVLDRINLVIFSIIILVLALMICIVISGWVELKVVEDIFVSAANARSGRAVLLGCSFVLSIMALKSIFLNSFTKDKSKEGILLENENGKLLVSKDTIENISTAVIKNYDSIENSTTRVDVDNENMISVFITLSAYQEAIIKDLAAKIQSDIKEAVKKSLDLDIKEVNIRIKSITQKKENVIKEN